MLSFQVMAVLSELHITEWLANKFFTNRLSLGRPCVAIYILFLGAFICALVNSILVIIIFAAFVIYYYADYGKFCWSGRVE